MDDNWDDIIDIPDFMKSREYDLARRRRYEELKLEEERIEREHQYRLYKQQQYRRAREIERLRRAKFHKLVVGGIIICVFASGLILFNAKMGKDLSSEQQKILQKSSNVTEVDFGEDYIIIEESPIITEPKIFDFSFEARLASIDSTGDFGVGREVNQYLINKISSNTAHDYFVKYGEMYGIDPYLMMAIATQESSFSHNSTLPGGANYNGHGVGMMQLETPNNREFRAYNYQTNSYDTMSVSRENANSLENNIRLGIMYFQEGLEYNKGNILLTIQSYNYGHGMIEMAVNIYAKELGVTPDDVRSNHSDTGWMRIVHDMHSNPTKYIAWEHSTYGDADYIRNVLRYFVGESTYFYHSGSLEVYNLNSYESELINGKTNVIR